MMLVPGIGEKTAHAIHLFIQDRGCIRDLSELSEISGIKDRKIEKMRKYFITNPASCARPVPVL
jgi:DNA uptake protein ComE-like DNA-binding protein